VIIGITILAVDTGAAPTLFSGGLFANTACLFFGLISFGIAVSHLAAKQLRMQNSIVQAKKDWEETFDIINDAITIHDADFNIIRANRAAAALLGIPLYVMLDRKCYRSYHGTDYPPETCPSCRTLATGVPSVTETFERSLNKHLEIKALPRRDRDNNIIGVVHIVRDITGQVRTEEQLRSLSLTDELTGLYNRRGFMTLASQQQKVAVRMKKGFYIVFADLDGLKNINDTLGHHEGCNALLSTASILRECFRESDIISRIGGDEFVVFSAESSGTGKEEAIYGRLTKKIDDFNAARTGGYTLSVSIGIVYCEPGRLCQIEDMINEADHLMYRQKKAKKNPCGKE